MRRAGIAIASVMMLVGCSFPQPPAQPAPAKISTPLAPGAVVQAVARQLVENGFEISTSDATGGILVASRKRDPKGQPEYLTCIGHPNSLGAQGRTTTLRVTVSAVAVSAGSDVTVRTSVRSEYRGGALDPSETDCVSNQKAETIVQAALGRP